MFICYPIQWTMVNLNTGSKCVCIYVCVRACIRVFVAIIFRVNDGVYYLCLEIPFT